ncbi:MAG: magnesium chelatase ATPase subunit I [Deltaproteobacteria bacterium]
MESFPFTAITGQDELQLALSLATIDPMLGGVLIFGDRGTGKSTAVRALAALLPRMPVVVGCPYHCDPASEARTCIAGCGAREHATEEIPVPVIDLPLGATEDRLVGSLDLEAALSRGERVFTPGLLARAHRGFLYIDEVNLLPDHLVDLLLDVAASGQNVVEREGMGVRHPARFVLLGSGNPEEGELRPQLLDRFGLCLEVTTPKDLAVRSEIVKRRLAFDRDPRAFSIGYAAREASLRDRLAAARVLVRELEIPSAAVERAGALCQALETDGLRGELTLLRAARAAAAFDGDREVNDRHLARVAHLALRHRLRRQPLDEVGSAARIDRVLSEILPS